MTQTPESRIFAVVLAAGNSRRFGRTKQTELLDGEPLVRRAAQLARKICGRNSLLVAGKDWRDVTRAAGGACEYLHINDQFADGIGTTIASTTRSLEHAADAMLLLLADQPLISEAHVRSMVAAWSGTDNTIVATAFAETNGPPVLLPASAFPTLACLAGDTGAKGLFGDPDYKLSTVRFDAAAIDIDQPSDLEKVTRALRGHASRSARN